MAAAIEQAIAEPARAVAGGIIRALVEAGVLTPKQLAYAQRVHAKLGVERPVLELLREIFPISDAQVRGALLRNRERVRLGEMLVELGYLREEFLELALAIQREDPVRRLRIGQVLVEHHLIEEAKLVEALALHLGFALEMPGTTPIDPALFAALSVEECEQHCIVPMRSEAQGVVVAFADPTDPESIAAAEAAFGAGRVVPAIAERAAIRAALARAAGRSEPTAFGAAPPPAIVDLLDELLEEALAAGASAVHLEPRADGVAVRQREGGLLASRRLLPLSLAPALLHHLRFLCRALDGPEREPGGAHFPHQRGERSVSVTLSSCSVEHGERVVLRLADAAGAPLRLDALGAAPQLVARLRAEIAARSGGLWLVAGPFGSGRTATFRALLGALAGSNHALATLERAPLVRIDGAAQLVLERGARFAELFAAALRQDPDVLGIDDLASDEAARLALAAASAGQRVVAVGSGSDAASAAVHLASLGLDRPLLASALGGVLAQVLLRRVCEHCAEPDGSRAARQLEELLRAESGRFRAGVGCSACRGTGHHGSVVVFELFVPDARQRSLLARRCAARDLARGADGTGSAALFEDAVLRAARGEVSAGEIARALVTPESPPALPELLDRMGS